MVCKFHWLSIVLKFKTKDFQLATHADGFKISGGNFVWSEFGVGTDYSECDGISMLIWRGKHDIHGTVESKPAPGFTLLGSSVQIAHYLVNKVNLFMQRQKEPGNMHVVADVLYQANKMK